MGVHSVRFYRTSYVFCQFSHISTSGISKSTEICNLSTWSALCIWIRYDCVKCAYEPQFSLFWVLYTPLDMYMFWMYFNLWVGTTKLGRPCRFDPPTWGPTLASVSCSLNSVMSCHPVPRPWFCSVYYMYIAVSRHLACSETNTFSVLSSHQWWRI